MTTPKNLDKLLQHKNNVINLCFKYAKSIWNKQEQLALEIMALGYKHDCSKFTHGEWEYLHCNYDPESKKTDAALEIHRRYNMHHPEWWDYNKINPRKIAGIILMFRGSKTHFVEMVCDWCARVIEEKNESVQDLMKWVNENATERFEFSKGDDIWKAIKYIINVIYPGDQQ